MLQEIKTFIEGADLDQVIKQRIELRSEIIWNLLNKAEYKEELDLLESKIIELSPDLFKKAYRLANDNSKTWLVDNLSPKFFKIWEVIPTTGNWFYVYVERIETGEKRYYSIGQSSDCKSTFFGDQNHFDSVKKHLELI